MGLLNYMVEGYDPERSRDVVFVPVALNYDRVIEDRVLVAADISGERKFRLRASDVARHLGKHLWQRITGRFYRFGYASVSFGHPLSLAAFLADHPDAEETPTGQLAETLMARVRDVVPVLPVPVVAAIMLERDDQSRDEIRDRFVTLVEDMKARGAHVHMPRGDLDYAVEVGLRLLELRHILRSKDGRYLINPPDRPLLCYYANSIGHLSAAIPEHEGHIAPDLASEAT
jgi:glycerol-3-phosphate O-acyltransferase